MVSEQQPVIDQAHLETYTLGDRALELELLTMFVGNGAGYIDAMAVNKGDEWWKAAHGLKGIAMGVGATEVADGGGGRAPAGRCRWCPPAACR